MKWHELETPSKPARKRVGRGIGSGYGKTAGRGTKGQNARSGGGVRAGFEGGQNPLMQRLPKTRGFKKPLKPLQLIHTDQLAVFKKSVVITKQDLKAAGLIKDANIPVKLLARGPVTHSLTIQIENASQAAKELITSSGGRLETVGKEL